MARILEQALSQEASLVIARENFLLGDSCPLTLLERPLLLISHSLQSQASNEQEGRKGVDPVQGSAFNKRRLPTQVDRGSNKDQEQVLEERDKANVEEEPKETGDLGSNVGPAVILAVESIASLAVKVVGQPDCPD